MSSSLRNGLVAFAMAATAVVIISVALLLTIGGSDSSQVGGATSVTPAVLGDTQAPSLTPLP
jgi:hypothetical protein